jgi:hypothetical protein
MYSSNLRVCVCIIVLFVKTVHSCAILVVCAAPEEAAPVLSDAPAGEPVRLPPREPARRTALRSVRRAGQCARAPAPEEATRSPAARGLRGDISDVSPKARPKRTKLQVISRSDSPGR